MLRALLLLALTVATAWGQVASSVLAGVVRDASAAVAPGVRVTATDQASGFSQTAFSGPEGLYLLGDLRPGSYSVSAEKDGFRSVIVSGVVLAVGQRGRLDFELTPGSAPQSITIAGSVSPLEAGDASVGFRTEYPSLVGLPLLGRNVIALVTLGPGAVPRNLGGYVHDDVNDV